MLHAIQTRWWVEKGDRHERDLSKNVLFKLKKSCSSREENTTKMKASVIRLSLSSSIGERMMEECAETTSEVILYRRNKYDLNVFALRNDSKSVVSIRYF